MSREGRRASPSARSDVSAYCGSSVTDQPGGQTCSLRDGSRRHLATSPAQFGQLVSAIRPFLKCRVFIASEIRTIAPHRTERHRPNALDSSRIPESSDSTSKTAGT